MSHFIVIAGFVRRRRGIIGVMDAIPGGSGNAECFDIVRAGANESIIAHWQSV